MGGPENTWLLCVWLLARCVFGKARAMWIPGHRKPFPSVGILLLLNGRQNTRPMHAPQPVPTESELEGNLVIHSVSLRLLGLNTTPTIVYEGI